MSNAADLRAQKCQHQVTALSADEVSERLQAINNWSLQDGKIVRKFSFKNYYDTLAFVNAIAYVIHAEDHHPELVVTYNQCVVKFDTHSVNGGKGGLSQNDFICAAKLDAIFDQSFV
ncbi:4a-hydroxytetrahydrobiopterin dehydratase [Herminiimonas arsenitoxidans]|uniref:4a-hydroxytetrahydrobiopterin dehydratase n=1 Tax=Herminiimonas arsenitoxidans TaxID=1809410 RepID=UPI0009708193|nr:4a-hydroxytetrahydrobiopterin dehydratase [Herminiimonas arsenitoxidans]